MLPASGRAVVTVLISLDVGGTLGGVTGPILRDRLAGLDGVTADGVARLKGRLQTARTLEVAAIRGWCGELGIPADAFPYECLDADLVLYDGAADAVRRIAALATTVTLSNSIATHAAHHRAVAAACPGLAALYTSYELGLAKPDPAVFRAVAGRHGATPADMIHVGDSWGDDVVGVVEAGGRAVWLSGGAPVPDPALLADGRIVVAEDITVAADRLATLA